MENEFSKAVERLVKSVPQGRVTTYGAVAAAAGKLHGARQVGHLLAAGRLGPGVPAHRVVNCKGGLAPEEAFGRGIQRALLEEEGVSFNKSGRVDLKNNFFQPFLVQSK